jgi:nucleotide-binding universal stress UspA family protein
MKNILLLTDFTSKSEDSHEFACKLFLGQECKFIFLSVQKLWAYTMDDLMVSTYYGIEEALVGDNKINVEEQVEKFKDRYASQKFQFEGVVDLNYFTKSVEENSAKYDIDLIVIGSDGVSGISEAILSSHTLRIIRNVDCPVLMVPESYRFERPTRIQYLLDYDDVFEKCGKELLIELINNYQPEIQAMRLTYGYKMPTANFEREFEKIQELFFDCNVNYFTQKFDNPMEFILSHLEIKPAQLQVLSAHKHSFLEEVFSSSHLKQIVNAAYIPVLILRDCHS